jgi:hypothetical protein
LDELSERRAQQRRAVSFSVKCRRLGPRHAGSTLIVDVVDLSLGGMCVAAPPWADVGNVVEVEIDDIVLRALVVALTGRGADGPAYAHLAFGSLTTESVGLVIDLLETPVGTA